MTRARPAVPGLRRGGQGGFRPRDFEIASLLARGLSQREVSRRFGLQEDAIKKRLQHRPALRRLVDDTAAALADEVGKQIARNLTHDTPKSLAFLQDVRDRQIPGQGDKAVDLRVRVVATRTLLDRQLPKRSEVTEERTVRFVFSAEDRRQIEADLEIVGTALPDADDA